MRLFFTISLIISIWRSAESQQAEMEFWGKEDRENLFFKLSTARNTTDSIHALNDIAWSYVFLYNDSAAAYSQKSWEKSYTSTDLTLKAKASEILGFALMLNGNYTSAFDIAMRGLRLASQINDSSILALHHRNLMLIYHSAGNSEEAFFHADLAMEFAPSDPVILGLKGEVLANIGYLDSAYYYYQQSLRYTDQWSGLHLRLGTYYKRTGNYEQALDALRRCINLAQNNRVFIDKMIAINEISEIYEETGQDDSAFFYAYMALNQKGSYSSPTIQLETSKQLANLYDQSNENDSTIKYLKISAQIKEDLDAQQKINGVQTSVFNEELKEIEARAKQAQYENRLRTTALLGSSFTLLIIAFILWRSRSQKQKSKRKIEIAYSRLKSTQTQLIHSEKMASLGELTAGIAHEIQNPLNFVNNFSDLNRELIDEQLEELNNGEIEEAKAIANDIKENEGKINHHGKRAEEIVKSMLQHSRTGSGEKELTDINALCDEYLRLSYHGFRAKDKGFNADFKLELDPALPKIQIVPQDIGRVLLNLINNAFQAVKDVENPMVTVITTSTKSPFGGRSDVSGKGEVNDSIQITVSDNGPGIPDDIKDKIFQPFFTTKPTGEGTGLGLSMSYDIVTKGHGGTIEVKSFLGKGTEFNVTLNIS